MYIKYQYNKEIEGKLQTQWCLFKTDNTRYTKRLAEQVRGHIAENINPAMAQATVEQMRGWFTSKYDELEYDEEWDVYELSGDGSFGSKKAEYVTIVEI